MFGRKDGHGTWDMDMDIHMDMDMYVCIFKLGEELREHN